MSMFMFTIVTVLTLVNICMIQERIGVAISATAKELSQYSYLYSLTGFPQSEAELAAAGKKDTEEMNEIMGNISAVFSSMEDMEGTVAELPNSDLSEEALTGAWDSINSSLDDIEASGQAIENSIEAIADDPSKLIFGIAKLAASEGLEMAKSRLIAAPLAKFFCKKHLCDSGKDTEAFLRQLGVVPSASGKYLDGLDFTQSSLFPYGSNEITIRVSYDAKVIPLLPLDFTFHFRQTAITHGWLSGEVTYKSSEDVAETITKANESIWTQMEPSERAKFIRKQVTADMGDEGYLKVSSFIEKGNNSGIDLYNPETNEFVAIHSFNPLGEAETLENLNDDVLQSTIEEYCGSITATTSGKTQVYTSKGQTDPHDCTGATNRVVLVIPEDEGFKEKMEEIIAKSEKRGVTIELVTGYGNGAPKTVVSKNPEPAGEEASPEPAGGE